MRLGFFFGQEKKRHSSGKEREPRNIDNDQPKDSEKQDIPLPWPCLREEFVVKND